MAEKKTATKKTTASSVKKPVKAAKVTKPAASPILKERAAVIRKKFNGIVVSTKCDKTAVVLVERVKMDQKYKKRYTVSRKYKVHDENNECKVGEKVVFVECRPLSRDKRWRIVK